MVSHHTNKHSYIGYTYYSTE